MGFLAVYIPQYRHHRDKSQLAVRKPVGRFNYRRVQNACKQVYSFILVQARGFTAIVIEIVHQQKFPQSHKSIINANLIESIQYLRISVDPKQKKPESSWKTSAARERESERGEAGKKPVRRRPNLQKRASTHTDMRTLAHLPLPRPAALAVAQQQQQQQRAFHHRCRRDPRPRAAIRITAAIRFRLARDVYRYTYPVGI